LLARPVKLVHKVRYVRSGQVLWNEIRHESSLHCVLAFGRSTFEARSAGSSAIKATLSNSQASDSGTKIIRSSFGNKLIAFAVCLLFVVVHIFLHGKDSTI